MSALTFKMDFRVWALSGFFGDEIQLNLWASQKNGDIVGENMQNMIILWIVVLTKYSHLVQTITLVMTYTFFFKYISVFKVPKCVTEHGNRVTVAITKLRAPLRYFLLTVYWYIHKNIKAFE